MCRELTLAPVFLFTSLIAVSQQAAPAVLPSDTSAPTARYAGPGIAAPEILSPNFSVSLPKHCDDVDGVVRLSAVVDANGIAHDVKTLRSDDPRLSNLAIEIVSSQRFKAGTDNGAAVAVAIELTVGLHTCAQNAKTVDGDRKYDLGLRAHPFIVIAVASPPSIPPKLRTPGSISGSPAIPSSSPPLNKVGANISPPVPLNEVEAEYSDYGRKKRITGVCLIGLIVDANGVPQNVHVVNGLEPSMDENALDAARQLRFKPAMRDGTTPVPVEISVEVKFILRKRKLF
jgi:TonB family protein